MNTLRLRLLSYQHSSGLATQLYYQQVLTGHMHSGTYYSVYPTVTEPLKIALVVEAKAWKTAYGRSLNCRYRASMDHIVQFVADYDKKLARPVQVRNIAEMCFGMSLCAGS